MLLVGPTGVGVMFLAHVAGGNLITNVTFTVGAIQPVSRLIRAFRSGPGFQAHFLHYEQLFPCTGAPWTLCQHGL